MTAKPLAATAAAAALLAACAPMAPSFPPADGVTGAVRASEQDCAVFAAVALELYRYDENEPLPLWAEMELDDGRVYRIACDWSRWGLAFPRTYDPAAPGDGFRPWVQFEPPEYRGETARVRTAYLMGPLAGMGRICTLHKRDGRWRLQGECETAWIS